MRINIHIDTASGEATVDTVPGPAESTPPSAGVAPDKTLAIDAGPAPEELTNGGNSAAPDSGLDDQPNATGESAGPAPSLSPNPSKEPQS